MTTAAMFSKGELRAFANTRYAISRTRSTHSLLTDSARYDTANSRATYSSSKPLGYCVKVGKAISVSVLK
jgi:hypothetical protein